MNPSGGRKGPGERSAVSDGLFSLPEVLEATQGRVLYGDPPTAGISGISTDSRTVRPGELFIALKGERFDGHAFLSDALRRGAIGAILSVSQHRIPENSEEARLRRGKVIIGVNDTLSALQGLARFHRGRFPIPLVGITGSNGKTTTKEMISAVLSRGYRVLKSEGNLNNQIGVPLTLLRMTARHEAAVVEMGISRPGELTKLVQAASPRVGVVTNIGPAHLETLGSIEGVAAAKAELLEALPEKDGLAILNRDDPFFDRLRQRTPCPVLTFGLHPESDVRADRISEKGDSETAFRLNLHPHAVGRIAAGRKSVEAPTAVEIRLPLLGAHNVMNALAACAVGAVFGIPPDSMKKALESFETITMRSQLHKWRGAVILNDSYNANPASMLAALETLARFETRGARIAVLGDMLELGDSAGPLHRQVGEQVARLPGGKLIAVGPQAREIGAAAVASGMDSQNVSLCGSGEEAVPLLTGLVKPGDVILVKGSRGMRLEKIIEALTKLSGER